MFRTPGKFITVLIFLFAGTATAQLENFERGLRANAQLIAFLEEHRCEIGLVLDCQRPLSAGSVRQLKEHFRELADWKREAFLEIIPQNDWVSGRPVITSAGPRFTLQEVERYNSQTLRRGPHLLVTLGDDAESREYLQRAGLAAATYLVLYDNIFRLSELFSRARKLRSIITNDMGPEGQLFYETFKTTLDEKIWSRMTVLVEFLAGKTVAPEELQQYLKSSFTALAVREKNILMALKSTLLIRRNLSEAIFYDRLEKVLMILSQVFGNAIGSIQFRSGKLKPLASSEVFLKATRGKLRPLDILFERTPFRLTDKFIPGHFGHVALWLGSVAELTAMTASFQGAQIPLLAHPDARPHLEKLAHGKLIAEVLRGPGVTLNPLENFLDIDDLLVMRPAPVSSPGDHVLRALRLLGRPYDFSYDIETEESLICSELIYRVFEEEEWPTTWELGRRTMNPDHVAWKALTDGHDPVLFYKDGKEVTSDLRQVLRSTLPSQRN